MCVSFDTDCRGFRPAREEYGGAHWLGNACIVCRKVPTTSQKVSRDQIGLLSRAREVGSSAALDSTRTPLLGLKKTEHLVYKQGVEN